MQRVDYVGRELLPSSLPRLSPVLAPPCSSEPPGPGLLNRLVIIVLKCKKKACSVGSGIIGNIVIRNYEKHFFDMPNLVNSPQRRHAADCPGHRSSTESQASGSSQFTPSSDVFHVPHCLADTNTCTFAWVIKSNLVKSKSVCLPGAEGKENGKLVAWGRTSVDFHPTPSLMSCSLGPGYHCVGFTHSQQQKWIYSAVPK